MSEKVEHTELPWKVDTGSPGELWIADAKRERPVCMVTASGEITDRDKADAAYIVLACNSYPALLAERDRLRTLLREMCDADDQIAGSERGTEENDTAIGRLVNAKHSARAAIKDTNQ